VENKVFFLVCHDIESAELPEDSATRQVVIRTGVVLHPEDGMMRNYLVRKRMGLGGTIGPGISPLNWIHMHDQVGIMAHAIENESVNGVLNAVAPSLNTHKDLAIALGSNKSSLLSEAHFSRLYGRDRLYPFVDGAWVEPKRVLESGYHFGFVDLDSAVADLKTRIPRRLASKTIIETATRNLGLGSYIEFLEGRRRQNPVVFYAQMATIVFFYYMLFL